MSSEVKCLFKSCWWHVLFITRGDNIWMETLLSNLLMEFFKIQQKRDSVSP